MSFSYRPFALAFILLSLLFTACGGGKKKQHPKGDHAEEGTPVRKVNITQDPKTRYWNDLSRYLGGLAPLPGSVLDSIDYRPEAQEHRKFFDDAWRVKDSISLKRIRRWFGSEYSQWSQYKGTVFYPFSGPDFMTIHTLFPDAKEFFLFGLEPEGRSPDLKALAKKDLRFHLEAMRIALRDIMGRTYFITSHMGGDLSRSDFNGTLPVILAFMARQGLEVHDVHRVVMQPDGSPRRLNPNENIRMVVQDSFVTGIEVNFSKGGDAPEQTLYYYSLDISDPFYVKQVDFQKAIDKLGHTPTFLKSASYLLHWGNFSLIRNQVLKITDLLVQDDTGVAYHFLDPKQWKIRLYGRYTTPIRQFTGQFQPDLNRVYIQDSAKIKPLDFLFGYSALKGAANILVAEKLPLKAQ
jgi:hypothetical protein